ncbi:MAG: hypothetical protein ABWZ40_03305 [Caulobacterales bacterium]
MELSTLGHPLSDFSYHAMMYQMPPNIVAGLGNADLKSLNIPFEADYASRAANDILRRVLVDEATEKIADTVKARLDRLDRREESRAKEMAIIKESILLFVRTWFSYVLAVAFLLTGTIAAGAVLSARRAQSAHVVAQIGQQRSRCRMADRQSDHKREGEGSVDKDLAELRSTRKRRVDV